MLLCMRTTIDIPEDLFRQAKQQAARTGQSFREVVSDSLRESFSRTSRPSSDPGKPLPVSRQAPGLCPGVDLSHSSALLDLMEESDDSS